MVDGKTWRLLLVLSLVCHALSFSLSSKKYATPLNYGYRVSSFGLNANPYVSPRAASNSRLGPVWSSKSDLLEETTTAPQVSAQEGEPNTTNVTLTFPSYDELMRLQPGEFVASESFACDTSGAPKFRVKLYPRGGGHARSKDSGFGMSYRVVPWLPGKQPDERVGVYLQYLSHDKPVDATFGLRMKGQQQTGPKFDVEWRAGIRFVTPSESNLRQGLANDFGAHLMQTPLLKNFCGTDGTVQLQVDVTIHDPSPIQINGDASSSPSWKDRSDIRRVPNVRDVHDPEFVRVGRIVVPVLNRLSQRPRMFELGAYPGVEYRILRILDSNGQERFTSFPGAQYELRPIYPLVPQLERQWPVLVSEREIPKLFTATMYNAVSAAGSLLTALVGLTLAFVISQAVSLFFIPSRSMDPTLQVGDVLLVDKVTPRLFQSQTVGNVVLFQPPTPLRDMVKSNGGQLTDRDLFVKRIAALPGDSVVVDQGGRVTVNAEYTPRDLCQEEPLGLIRRYLKSSQDVVVDSDSVYVLGDCGSVSIDSRVWGPLKKTDIVGKPILRIWPLERFGSVPSLPTTSTTQWDDPADGEVE